MGERFAREGLGLDLQICKLAVFGLPDSRITECSQITECHGLYFEMWIAGLRNEIRAAEI